MNKILCEDYSGLYEFLNRPVVSPGDGTYQPRFICKVFKKGMADSDYREQKTWIVHGGDQINLSSKAEGVLRFTEPISPSESYSFSVNPDDDAPLDYEIAVGQEIEIEIAVKVKVVRVT